MFTIPFTARLGFRPRASIPGNDTSDTPVEFDLVIASGPDQARVKSLLQATAGMTLALDRWSPEVQRNVVTALQMSSDLFVGTVRAIRNLKAPVGLCRHVGLKVDEKARDEDEVAIETGVKFSRVATYLPGLALELAFEIQRFTNEAQIDPRFFASPSGSPASAATPSGTASPAPLSSDAAATVASPDPTAPRPTTT